MRVIKKSRKNRQPSLLVLFLASFAVHAHASNDFLRNGVMGMVISHIEFALAPNANLASNCPNGMTLNLQEIYANTPAGKRREDETDQEYLKRLSSAGKKLGRSEDGRDFCMHPQLADPEPNFHSVVGSQTAVWGLNLDGRDSAEDFSGVDGESGIDNQWYRTVGCSRSFQPNGMSLSFNIAMLTGSWGIVLEVKGVDDLRNDDQVQVSIYANGDPIRLSPSREPLSYASYSPDTDERYWTTVPGRIEDGVLSSQPADITLRSEVNSMLLERVLRDARVELTLAEDGSASGYLAGYAPVESLYDMLYGYRTGRKFGGELAPLALRSNSANGAAFVLGHTCHGAYQALYANADGHPDSETGQFTSISMQYRIKTLPAFILSASGPDVVTTGVVAAEITRGDAHVNH